VIHTIIITMRGTITMRSLAIRAARSSFRGMADMHISRRSQRGILSMLFPFIIIYHAVKKQEKVMFQQQGGLYQQNRTMVLHTIVTAQTMPITMTVKVEIGGLGDIPFLQGGGNLLGLDEKQKLQGSYSIDAARTTPGQTVQWTMPTAALATPGQTVAWTMPNITFRIYNPAMKV
jgi:hypothetical protein